MLSAVFPLSGVHLGCSSASGERLSVFSEVVPSSGGANVTGKNAVFSRLRDSKCLIFLKPTLTYVNIRHPKIRTM